MARRVFISFQHKDRHAKELLKAQSGNKHIDLDFNDQSPGRALSSRWKSRMKNRINNASATVVMIGKDTYRSKAVNWEIEQSRNARNKIIGVQIDRGQHHRLPPAMRKGEELKKWKIKNISNRLRKRK
ncbi:TIR domain-containing protein [Candidatus Latescibacterota bacterium]